MPMISRSMLYLTLLVALLAVGCATQAGNRDKALARLQVGMTKEEVESIMGKPQKHETQGNTEVLFYATANPGGAQEDIMPVMIVSGRLVGWGRLDHESAMQLTNVPRDGRRVD